MGHNPHRLSNPAETAKRQIRAYELKLQGWSYRRIAAAMTAEGMEVSHQTVANLIKAAIDERVDPLVEEYRALELEKLEEAERPLWQQILSDDPRDRGRLARNVEVLIRVSERRSRLLGLDAPQQAELNATVQHKPDDVLALIETARQRVADDEARLKEGQE